MIPSSSLLSAIENYLAGQASPEEERLINEWYHSFDEGDTEKPEEFLELRAKVGGRLWRRLTETIEAREGKRNKFIIGYRKGLVAAASLVLVIVSSLLFVRHRRDKVRLTAPQALHDVAPGGDKAVLTLGDGTRIALDSLHKGMLTKQGSTTIVQMAGGKLAYEAAPSQGGEKETVTYNTISTPRGGQYQITLPDGTAVWLNAATSLRYPTRFEGSERRVLLSGEAYFEVSKNSRKPFFVDMPDHRRAKQDTFHVQVLGTSFNVNGYEDESTIKTTLLEGTVKVLQGQQASLLFPGQQAQTDDRGGVRIIRDADTEEALAWKNGLFQYNSTDLKTIMRQLARWYDVHIIYEGNVKEETFSGTVPRMENVSQFLHMLALTNTVHFTIEGKEIHVHP